MEDIPREASFATSPLICQSLRFCHGTAPRSTLKAEEMLKKKSRAVGYESLTILDSFELALCTRMYRTLRLKANP